MHQLQCSKVVIHWLFQMLAKAGRNQRLFVSLENLHLHPHSIFLGLLLAKLLGHWV
uniref:ORF55c n=1 Tax=Pinus koraiensis TaxID=88728 RepID=Q85WX2_PINKO|nr:ORF55c [Pinus koraiensis]